MVFSFILSKAHFMINIIYLNYTTTNIFLPCPEQFAQLFWISKHIHLKSFSTPSLSHLLPLFGHINSPII